MTNELFQFLVEFKLVMRNGQRISCTNDAIINQIFENQYYEIFDKKGSNSYIIGVGFNPFEEEIISEIVVKKFKGDNYEFREKENWEIEYEKKQNH